jgi:hypothetical protein
MLTTIPDSTSLKFILLGTVARQDQGADGKQAIVFLDFETLKTRHCQEADFEKWYARSERGKECLMGHKVQPVRPHDRNGTNVSSYSNGTNAES